MEFRPIQDPEAACEPTSDFDAVLVIGRWGESRLPATIQEAIERIRRVHAAINDRVGLHVAPELAGGRLVLAPTGALDHDYDDVRSFAEAAAEATLLARDAGSRRPLLLVTGVPSDPRFAQAREVALLGAAAALWQPLEARERGLVPDPECITALGFEGDPALAQRLQAIEAGRRLARDLGGTEPERMAPPRFADECARAFTGLPVTVEVIDDLDRIQKEYPLLFAVGRASLAVERHHPRVVRLEYVGDGPIERTLLFAGKGVVYDTGGADLKVGGHMAGMSRDKGGAAGVAGFLKTVALLAPPKLRVIAELGVVRNSIGADSFVSDEIHTSHAGKRVRIGNTDAEGRLVLADLLSHLRIDALESENPALMTVATLTGHASLAVGPYTIAIENGPAEYAAIARSLSAAGDLWGDPFAISRSRREDYDFVRGRTKADDILSCNNAPSSQTVRGHQFPMAFLVLAAGLDAHAKSSDHPLPFTHIDIAGSGCMADDWQHGSPSAAPLVALTAAFVE